MGPMGSAGLTYLVCIQTNRHPDRQAKHIYIDAWYWYWYMVIDYSTYEIFIEFSYEWERMTGPLLVSSNPLNT